MSRQNSNNVYMTNGEKLEILKSLILKSDSGCGHWLFNRDSAVVANLQDAFAYWSAIDMVAFAKTLTKRQLWALKYVAMAVLSPEDWETIEYNLIVNPVVDPIRGECIDRGFTIDSLRADLAAMTSRWLEATNRQYEAEGRLEVLRESFQTILNFAGERKEY